MTVLLITFAAMAAFFVLMSVGILFGGKPIQGSCGGLNNITGMETCELCGGSPAKCDELSVQTTDAMRQPHGSDS